MTTGESPPNDGIHSSKLVYSLGVGFVAIGAIIGIANFVSTRYISLNVQFGLRLLFFFLFAGSLGLVLNIIMHGLALVGDFRKFDSQIFDISGKFFDAGMFTVFVGLSVYFPFYLIIVAMPTYFEYSFAGIILAYTFLFSWNLLMIRILFDLRFLSSLKKISGLKTDNLKSSIFWFSCKAIARTTSFITLILAFLFSGSKLKAYELLDSKYFPYLKRKMLEAAPIVIILLIFLPSALLSDFVILNSFSIVINNELYEEDEEQILMVTIKIGGFASVDDPTQITVWVYSDKWERKNPISLDNQGYEKGFYRVFIIVTDFKEGIHYVEVVSSSAKETFRKREEFFINKSSTKGEES